MSKIDLGQDCEKKSKNKFGRKHMRDMKLQDLEKQLQFAESRCGTLKQQLDYIKRLYGWEYNSTKSKNNESFTSLKNGLGDGDGDNVNFFNSANAMMKNSENELCTDYGCRSIFLSKTKTCDSSNQYFGAKAKMEHEEKKIGNYSKPTHLKLLKINKKKNFKKFKGKKKVEDTLAVNNVSSQSQTQIWQDPFVEIYKNSALKAESESGLEILFNGTARKKSKDTNFVVQKRGLDADNVENFKDEIVNVSSSGKVYNSIIEKKGLDKGEEELPTKNPPEIISIPQATQNEATDFFKNDNYIFEEEKGYCQPTISSKKKKVDKDVYSCFRNINIKNIPFIAAKSTAPSHNIGINIQQVLSIMKKKNPINENFASFNNLGNPENSLLNILAAKRGGIKTSLENERGLLEGSSQALRFLEYKKGIRSHLSHWNSNSNCNREKVDEKFTESVKKTSDEDQNDTDWSSKVNKLKKVLVFLHEDFIFLNQKYKKLQKKLVKRNITTIEAKGELGEIEKNLEKKEEEITVVIGLYKEVLHLKENLKNLEEKYNSVTNGKISISEELQQTNSNTHFQMQSLLRKIQNFQDRLKS